MRFFEKVFIAALSLTLILPAHAEDAAGEDHPLLQRFSESNITHYQSQAVSSYTLALGGLKRVKGVLEPEYSRRISGELTRITYEIPSYYPSRDVFDFFSQQVSNLGADYLYRCERFTCGSSNHWANRIFNVSVLYGPERNQAFFSSALKVEDQDYLISVYTITRGNKRVYAHLDILETNDAFTVGELINPDLVVEAFETRGRYLLSDLPTDAEDLSGNPLLKPLVAALKRESRLQFWVVGHHYEAGAFDDLMNSAMQDAERVKTALVAGGIAADRLEVQSVGPLVPPGRERGSKRRVELVVKP